VPRRFAPEAFLDVQGLGDGFTDQIGIAHGRRQVGGVREPRERVVDLLAGCVTLGLEQFGVLVVEGPALSRPAAMAS
jgi:hypothetical protein